MQARDAFAEKYGIGPKLAYRLQLCCEELVYEMLAGCYPKTLYKLERLYTNAEEIDISIDISYSDVDAETLIAMASGGYEFNPFMSAELDGTNAHLGITMLKKIARKLEYRFSGRKNHIEIIL